MSDPTRQRAVGYLIAVLATGLVAGLRAGFAGALGDVAPVIPFVLPVFAAAWCGGLGPGLVEKAGRGIRLTAAGLGLADRARSLRVATEDTVREIGELGAGTAGHVRIGVLPTLARFLMAPLCREFLQDTPRVTLKTVIAQNDVLAAQLEAGEVDLVVTTAARAACRGCA